MSTKEYKIDELFGAHLDVAVMAALGHDWRIEQFAIRCPHPERHMTCRHFKDGKVHFDHIYDFHKRWEMAGFLVSTGRLSIVWHHDDIFWPQAGAEGVPLVSGRTVTEAVARAFVRSKIGPVIELRELEQYADFQSQLIAELKSKSCPQGV